MSDIWSDGGSYFWRGGVVREKGVRTNPLATGLANVNAI